MAYTPQTFATGDVITSAWGNKVEQGIANAPLDNGRYQAEFGLDGDIITNCYEDSGVISLVKSYQVSNTASNNTVPVGGTTGVAEVLDATFTANMDTIDWVEFYIANNYSCTSDLVLTVYDATSSVTVGTVTVPYAQYSNGLVRFTPSSPIAVTRGHIIHLRLMAPTGNGGSYYSAYVQQTDVIANAYKISTDDAWSTITSSTTHDLRMGIQYSSAKTSGTVIKTFVPSDLKKWGNIKWSQTTPANTSVVCDVTNTPMVDLTGIADSNGYGINSALAGKQGTKFTAISNTTGLTIKAKLYRHASTTADLLCEVYSDANGLPNVSIGSVSIPYTSINTTAEFKTINITGLNLIKDVSYYVVFTSTTSSSYPYYIRYANIAGTNNYYNNNGSGSSWAYYTDTALSISISNTAISKSITSIGDISDIDHDLCPSLDVKWTLTRNALTDQSPTMSNPSITWEGIELSNVASGVYSDTSTTITGGSTFTKTIPIGFKAKKGRLIAVGYSVPSSTNNGCIIHFTTNPDDATGIISTTDNGSIQTVYAKVSGQLTTNNLFSTQYAIKITDAYIDGLNLIIKFYCSGTTSALYCPHLLWEVER